MKISRKINFLMQISTLLPRAEVKENVVFFIVKIPFFIGSLACDEKKSWE